MHFDLYTVFFVVVIVALVCGSVLCGNYVGLIEEFEMRMRELVKKGKCLFKDKLMCFCNELGLKIMIK